jgi:hypothetical protein
MNLEQYTDAELKKIKHDIDNLLKVRMDEKFLEKAKSFYPNWHNIIDESYSIGFEIGLTWAERYRPGGPFIYTNRHSTNCLSGFDRRDAMAHLDRAKHSAWQNGFIEGCKKNKECSLTL